MPLFAYTARSRDGMLIEAQMDAPSRDSVATQIIDSGATPIHIAPTHSGGSRSVELSFSRKKKIRTEDLIIFCQHMFRLSKAGIPIIRAITGLAESTRNPAFGDVLESIANSLRSGRQLSESMRLHPKVFPRLFMSVVQIGEDTGQIDDAFEQMGKYLALDLETRKRIKAAMRYPTMVFAAIAGAMVLINVFVIPAFARTFEGLGAELPWATKILIATSDFTVHWWPVVLAISAGTAYGVRSWQRTPTGRYKWDHIKLRLPIVGNIIERATLARFARSFAVTASAGIPVLQTLQTVANAVDNDYVAERILTMRSHIERGETLTRAAAACGLFDAMILQMLSVGEEIGAVPEMCREIAETFEAEVDYELKNLSDTIEPIMIVVIGGIVLVLALGVYLPMWDMAGAAKGGG